MLNELGRRRAIAAMAIGFCAAASVSPALAQPVFDGTTGGQAAGAVAVDTIDVTQGTRAGGNVFHSFTSFSIPADQTITFTDNMPTTPVANIINRVTGTSVSEINGRLRSTVDGADLYLINPNGVVMGSGSIVDVPASFYLSTADELRFENDEVLQANVGSSTFASAEPKAFGFIDSVAGDISITEGLVVGNPGANIGIVGGNITVQDGTVTGRTARIQTTAGTIAIVAVGGASNVPIDPAAPGLNLGGGADVTIRGGPLRTDPTVVSTSVTNESTSGSLVIQGRNIRIVNGDVASTALGTAPGADITLLALNNVLVHDLSQIFTESRGSGGAGDVTILARNVGILRDLGATAGNPFQNGVFSRTLSGSGDGGSVFITADDWIELSAAAIQASNSPLSTGAKGGSVVLWSRDFLMSRSLISSASVSRVGSTGDVDIEATNSVQMLDVSAVRSSSFFGSAGSIRIRASDVVLDGFRVDGPNDGLLSSVSPNSGRSGDIEIDADQISVRNGFRILSLAGSAADGGQIRLDADAIEVLNGSIVSSETQGTGVAGGVTIMGDTLLVSGAGSALLADSTAQGQAGNLRIDMRTVEISDGGRLSAVARGAGNAGFVTVCCSTDFTVTGFGSQVIAGTALGSTGDAGRILISAKDVNLRDGGRMTVATDGTGRGGEILVRAQTFTAEDPTRVSQGRTDAEAAGLATLSSAAGADSASAGRIAIEAGTFNLLNGAVITTDTFGASPAGSISLRASELNIKGEQAVVSSKALGSAAGDAGNIDIGTVNFAISDGASFSTLAESGAGGNIKFAWNGIGRIDQASVTTDVLGGSGGGGSIVFGGTVALLDFDTSFEALCGDLARSFATYEGLQPYNPNSPATPILILSGSTIDASAVAGSGGTVSVAPNVVLISDGDLPPDFDVSSVSGPAGSVLAPAPFVPPSPLIVPERNITTRCTGRDRNSLSDDLTGRASVGADPSVVLPAGLLEAVTAVVANTADKLCAV